MSKEELKTYANKLMFDMSEEEYDTLLIEFDILLKKMDYINKIDGIEDIEPSMFPFKIETSLREDEVKNTISTQDALKNCKNSKYDQVIVPKVVGE